MSSTFKPWGMYPNVDQHGVYLKDRHQPLPSEAASILPFGNGRSYGDSCLNEEGDVLSTRHLNHFMDFDKETGVMRCESGVLFSEILEVIVPQGWFLPVTPGTKYVTVGGAIANDVHGKNHHVAGTFGCHVRQFELLRSDGQRMVCSAQQNKEYFQASIGGMGLTGMITWAEFQLKKITNSAIEMETIKFARLEDFFELSAESDEDYEYTMSWVDCIATGDKLGRGHFMRGNHASAHLSGPAIKLPKFQVPLTPPVSLVNGLTLKAFNVLYYERQRERSVKTISHYDPFFYPLDSILNWNRIYGRKGFLQYQCVVPKESSREAMGEILRRISSSGFGSFLAVLKVCGDIESPGWLSFPMPGATLALDFPYVENKTLKLFETLDDIVINAAGRIYPAKDAHMNARLFKQFYPLWEKMLEYKDPKFSSSMWRRVTEEDKLESQEPVRE